MFLVNPVLVFEIQSPVAFQESDDAAYAVTGFQGKQFCVIKTAVLKEQRLDDLYGTDACDKRLRLEGPAL